MPIATLTNIEKTFGQRVLFDKVNLNVYRGERIGLVGDNGTGKTSLFKVLVGELTPDAGAASTNRSIKVGYLRQDPSFDPTNTVIDEAELAFLELHELSHRLREIEHEMAGMEGEALEKVLGKYQKVQHDFELAGGYAWRHKLEATLLGIGLEREIDRKSTRLNSSHSQISYAVFCLKKKNKKDNHRFKPSVECDLSRF